MREKATNMTETGHTQFIGPDWVCSATARYGNIARVEESAVREIRLRVDSRGR